MAKSYDLEHHVKTIINFPFKGCLEKLVPTSLLGLDRVREVSLSPMSVRICFHAVSSIYWPPWPLLWPPFPCPHPLFPCVSLSSPTAFTQPRIPPSNNHIWDLREQGKQGQHEFPFPLFDEKICEAQTGREMCPKGSSLQKNPSHLSVHFIYSFSS